MPEVSRNRLPEALLRHLLRRVRERQITHDQITALAKWLDTQPEVPSGKWFKQFDGFTLCGEGELIRTFLLPGQLPGGTEI